MLYFDLMEKVAGSMTASVFPQWEEVGSSSITVVFLFNVHRGLKIT